MQDREEWMADTLLALADTLIADFDVIDFLSTLVERAKELTDASEVGLMLTDPQGHLRVMASSTYRMRMVELFELQSSQGPCFDCFRSGDAIVNVDLDLEGTLDRWPVFTPMARTAGFQVVHALPMRVRSEVIGAANVFHATRVTMSDRDVHLAQALTHIATIGILQERAVRSATGLSKQLQYALKARVVIEQAKGIVAEHAGVDMDTAIAWLRTYSRNQNLRLADVALAIVKHTLTAEVLQITTTSSVDTVQTEGRQS